MISRKVVTASAAAALALGALAVPAVNAQGDEVPVGDADTGSLSAGSLEGGSLDSGSLGSGDGSLSTMVPDTGEVCELPDLGGSVAKFYPLFGISGVPTGVLDLITSALGEFPNVLDMVAGDGGGAALLGQAGSVRAPLCSTIFGGEMVMPPVTVIVDEDGVPVTTVTGTIAARADAATSTSTSSNGTSDPAGRADSDEVGSGGVEDADRVGVDVDDSVSTTVPVP